MGLVLLDAQDSPTYAAQAVIDKVDVYAALKLGQQTGVVSGCTVTPHSGAYGVDVAAGTIVYQGTEQAVSAVSNLAPGAPSTSDRKDIVQVSSTGTVSIKAGTPCGLTSAVWSVGCGYNPPVKPAPDSGSILLAELYIPGTYTSTTTIASGMLVDKTAGWVSPTGTAQGESDIRAIPLQNLTPTAAVSLNGQQVTDGAASSTAAGIPIMSQLGAWIPDPNARTYVASNQYSVPGNQTAQYVKGMVDTWTDSGGVKYGVVLSSTYTSGSPGYTTVTLIPTTDYTIASGAITAPSYSYTLPPGFPTHFTWAPALTGVTGVTLAIATWTVHGGLCLLEIAAAGSSSSTSFGATAPIASSLAGAGAIGTAGDAIASIFAATNTMAGMGINGTAITFTKEPGATITWTNSNSRSIQARIIYPI